MERGCQNHIQWQSMHKLIRRSTLKLNSGGARQNCANTPIGFFSSKPRLNNKPTQQQEINNCMNQQMTTQTKLYVDWLSQNAWFVK